MFNLIRNQGHTTLNQDTILPPTKNVKMLSVDENIQQWEHLSTPLGVQIGTHLGIV